MDWTALIIVLVIVAVGGVFITLSWWKIADRWADAEHKRFEKPDDDTKTGETQAPVVIRDDVLRGDADNRT